MIHIITSIVHCRIVHKSRKFNHLLLLPHLREIYLYNNINYISNSLAQSYYVHNSSEINNFVNLTDNIERDNKKIIILKRPM